MDLHSIEPFALYTIPKSGSHLLIKTLYYMSGFSPKWHTAIPDIEQNYKELQFPYTHCCLSSSVLEHYTSSLTKQIIGIRDLRDVCVSIVYQIDKGVWPQFTHNPKMRKQFQKLSFDEKLLFVIEQEYELDLPKTDIQLGIRKVAEQASLLVRNPAVLICRFEELVGSKGGGSDEAQKGLLGKIAQHIGISISAEQIEQLSNRIYGNESSPFGQGDFVNYQSTFREGKIGSWKSAFKEVHKQAFKARLGQSLIDLGYEKDFSW